MSPLDSLHTQQTPAHCTDPVHNPRTPSMHHCPDQHDRLCKECTQPHQYWNTRQQRMLHKESMRHCLHRRSQMHTVCKLMHQPQHMSQCHTPNTPCKVRWTFHRQHSLHTLLPGCHPNHTDRQNSQCKRCRLCTGHLSTHHRHHLSQLKKPCPAHKVGKQSQGPNHDRFAPRHTKCMTRGQHQNTTQCCSHHMM
jgi:hypothetical protein